MRSRDVIGGAVVCAVVWAFVGCGQASEAPRVQLPVLVDGTAVGAVTTDLGYEVELSSARVAFSNLVFTVAGEVHTASIWHRLADTIIPTAHAHPGHYQGGDVTGELVGDYVVDWVADDGRELGVATLIAASYSAANFTFGRGPAEALDGDDALIGHTALLTGTATRDNHLVSFTIVVDSPEGRVLVGAPFEAELGENATGALYLRFSPLDPLEGDTIFDAIDFAALDADDDGILSIEPGVAAVEDAYNSFRRAFQTHDHYSVEHQE